MSHQTDTMCEPHNRESLTPASSDVAGGQLLAMFFKLQPYGRRVALAQMAALVKVQGEAA